MEALNYPLRNARKALRLTAIALAISAETTEQRIYAFERRRFNPHIEEAERLAQVLRQPATILFPELFSKGER